MARIAVVEDDFDLTRLVRDVLTDDGHEVVSYVKPSGDILVHLRDLDPDLAILDLCLDCAVDGLDIIEALRADTDARAIPLIVCSGDQTRLDENRAWLESHDVAVLPKPFDIDDLERLVDRTLTAAH